MNVNQYRRLKMRALRPLQKLIRAVLHSSGVPVTNTQATDVAIQLWRPTLTARETNYNAALAYLHSLRLPPAVVIPTVRPYSLPAMTRTVETAVTNLRLDDKPITEANRRDTQVIEHARKAIEGPVARLALAPARQTIQEIGEDEDVESVGWARVLVGAYSCSFCAMLASRGPVYTSRETAIGRGGNPLDAYHQPYIDKRGVLVGGVCDCEAVLVTSYGSWEGRKAWEALEDLWQGSGGKASGKAARLAFRRVWDKKVREDATGEYLAESIRPDRAA